MQIGNLSLAMLFEADTLFSLVLAFIVGKSFTAFKKFTKSPILHPQFNLLTAND